MFKRPIVLLAILIAAGGLPFLFMNPELANDVKGRWQGLTGGVSAGSAFAGVPGITPAGLNDPLPPPPPATDFREVIRLDVPPEFVIQRWPKVMTVSAESGLQGLRVPLITGTNPDDLVGSLTYYFDLRRQVQRVTFQGSTGDPRRLIALVTGPFGMQAMPSLDAGLYLTQRNRKPESFLRISYPPVVRVTTPNTRTEIVLEINRPGSNSQPSEAMLQLLEFQKQVNRW